MRYRLHRRTRNLTTFYLTVQSPPVLCTSLSSFVLSEPPSIRLARARGVAAKRAAADVLAVLTVAAPGLTLLEVVGRRGCDGGGDEEGGDEGDELHSCRLSVDGNVSLNVPEQA